jgi:hypothetical protein
MSSPTAVGQTHATNQSLPFNRGTSSFLYAEFGIMQSVFSVALLVSTLTSAPWPMATVR